jgi:hypothetical protein
MDAKPFFSLLSDIVGFPSNQKPKDVKGADRQSRMESLRLSLIHDARLLSFTFYLFFAFLFFKCEEAADAF